MTQGEMLDRVAALNEQKKFYGRQQASFDEAIITLGSGARFQVTVPAQVATWVEREQVVNGEVRRYNNTLIKALYQDREVWINAPAFGQMLPDYTLENDHIVVRFQANQQVNFMVDRLVEYGKQHRQLAVLRAVE